MLVKAMMLLSGAVAVHAADAPKLVNCWDGSFAYTRASVAPVESQDTLLIVRLESEAQGFLKSLASSEVAGWGNGAVSFYIPKSECKTTAGRPDLLDCVTHSGRLTVEYDENFESRRILNLPIGELTLRTSNAGKMFRVDLGYRRQAGEGTAATVEMSFRATDGASCSNHIGGGSPSDPASDRQG